jgi:hypothetical protein
MSSSREPNSSRATKGVVLFDGALLLLHWLSKHLRLFIVVCFLIVGASGFAAFLSYDGFCFKERRFLEIQEYYNAAAEAAMQSPAGIQLVNPDSIVFKTVRKIDYASVADFFSSNPVCCSFAPYNVGDLGPDTTLLDRLLGNAARIVQVTYDLNFLDERGQKNSKKVTGRFAVTNCGQVRKLK